MSIKRLFGDASSDYKTENEQYEFVESSVNAEVIKTKQNLFTPQIDYSDPENFVRYGSAYLFYKNALSYVADYFPYDGSSAQKVIFYNGLLDGERYVFDNLYPTSTGYVIMSANGWGALNGSMSTDGYGLPATLEYITFKGGPHTSSEVGTKLSDQIPSIYDSKTRYGNIYDTNIYETFGLSSEAGKGTRESNLRANFDDGVTVEFWLKKAAFDNAKTEKEVVFDMWNNYSLSTADYGRLIIQLTGAATGSPFLFTVQSGTAGGGSSALNGVSIGNNLTTTSLTSWGHYAFSFYNTGSSFVVKLYENGSLNDTKIYNSPIKELNSKGMVGRIGALLRAPSSSAAPAGAAKLSASLDEFRYWKEARNSQQINRNWFANVNGGTNTDISNTTLGVYFKFNEGITTDTTVDSTVLDYSGRISNGTWTGYTTNSRNTGSAIVSASAAIYEEEDPIIRIENPNYTLLSSSLCTSGSVFDLSNNSSFIHYMPNWTIEEHEDADNDNLKVMGHIIGSYFDQLFFLIREIPKIRQPNYITSSVDPIPFAIHLARSMGTYVPDTFINTSIVERLLNRNETELFEGELTDIKNEIYLNLYNNFAEIYKSKGTSRAIRNIFRCFNMDDSIIQFKQYATDTTYELTNNLIQKQVYKNFLNFNNKDNTSAVVYQAVDASNSETRGYISGSYKSPFAGVEDPYGATLEAEVMFPTYHPQDYTISRNQLTSSLFGFYTANTSSARRRNSHTTFVSSGLDYANLQVFAARPESRSKNVRFILTSSNSPFPVPTLTSSLFFDVYDNNTWNLSVRIKPQGYPMAGTVTGSIDYKYDIIFQGTNYILDSLLDQFSVTASVSHAVGEKLLRSSKRVYAGANRQDITGATTHISDVLVSDIKYWTKYVDDLTLTQHSRDMFNAGISGSYRNISPLDSNNSNYDLLNLNTLALYWNFENTSTSNATGNFYTTDYSSGSATLRDNYSWLGRISGYQHSGYGYGFATSSTDVIDKRNVNAFQFIDPEQAASSEMIKIRAEDDTLFERPSTVPSYLFTLEKSLQGTVSQEMMKFLAGAVDFNNVIGEPVNRYRDRYKNLEKLREVFFRRVTKTTDVEKFVDYYKWFDDTISTIISQLIPASADFISDVQDLIEPHALERAKYESKFPTLEFKVPEIEFAPMKGIHEKLYSWKFGGSPLPSSPRDPKKHGLYWQDRAERFSEEEIKTSNSTINDQRETIRKEYTTHPYVSSSIPKLRTTTGTSYMANRYTRRFLHRPHRLHIQRLTSSLALHGGVNFEPSKNIHLAYNAVSPYGPVINELEAGFGRVFIPQNVLLSFMDDIAQTTLTNDPKPEHIKTKRFAKVLHGRDFQGGLGYSNVKSSVAFPFNLYDSDNRVKEGYQSAIRKAVTPNITITNVHNDVYGDDMDKPMQGPFTEYAVGGHQSRHVRLNKKTLDTWQDRPEAWKILLAACPDATRTIDDSGAIGLAGPDYPSPAANAASTRPYPVVKAQKAVYFRDFVAKRPVNIRNIHHTTGSTILGNYNNNYDFVRAEGAYSNPRKFVDSQPVLPAVAFQSPRTEGGGASNIRTFLSLRRTEQEHFNFLSGGGTFRAARHPDHTGEYSLEYLQGGLNNKSVIRSKFSAPGAIETISPGYNDIRGDEFSPYNSINYRNLSVRKPWQGPSGTISEPVGTGTPGIRVYDIHGKDFGLASHLARHSGKFGRDSLFVTNPGARYEQLPSFHKNNYNRIKAIKMLKDNPTGSTTPRYETSQIYDNYYVSQQIPKTTLQYAWITSSYKTLVDRYGIVSSDFLVSSSAGGIQESITFVQASEFVSFNYLLNSNRSFGLDERSPFAAQKAIRTDFAGLNLNTLDLVQTQSSMRDGGAVLGKQQLSPAGDGSSLTHPAAAWKSIYNNDSTTFDISARGTASATNALILNRQGPYGWPSWKQARQSLDHKLMRTFREKNKIYFLSATGSGIKHAKFDLPPVSMRGRPLRGTIQISLFEWNSYTADFSNNYVYFNLNEVEDHLHVNWDTVSKTAGEYLAEALNSAAATYSTEAQYLYTENIFPSQRNEFLPFSRTKIGYDNMFWRNNNTKRITLGTTMSSSLLMKVTQSSWPLDPPSNFLTRTGSNPIHYGAIPGTISSTQAAAIDLLRLSDAGELQNTYSSYFTGSVALGRRSLTDYERLNILTPAGGLYALKQTISSPRSVASPSGISIPQTASGGGGAGSRGRCLPFAATKQIQVFGGEAYWDAPNNAGYVDIDFSAMGTTGTFLSWKKKPSEPWAFETYEDFNYLLKKVSTAKEFAVVPEYRIDEHLDAINFNGVGSDWSEQRLFTLPHTKHTPGTASFYKDYSNSEFLKEFLNVQDFSGKWPHYIRLVCSASIRFNPYKGFYPVQRTLDCIERFRDSYGFTTNQDPELGPVDTDQNWFGIPGTELEAHYSGSMFKPTMAPFFAPGILYNTIKSGIAVDWPLVTEPAKIERTPFGDSVNTHNYAMTRKFGQSGYPGYVQPTKFFDERLPFEAILDPDLYGPFVSYPPADLDSHPSCSISVLDASGKQKGVTLLENHDCGEVPYTLYMANFLGGIIDFYLENDELTSVKSDWWPREGKTIEPGTYMARVKMARSMFGEKDYSHEHGVAALRDNTGGAIKKQGGHSFTGSAYVTKGARAIFSGSESEYGKSALGFVQPDDSRWFPIPQDPANTGSNYRESFTMYSRPTAFGPPMAGMGYQKRTVTTNFEFNTIHDSFTGYNGAFTPPYYNGEAWCDMIFRVAESDASTKYTIEDIQNSVAYRYWRMDPGYMTASATGTFSGSPDTGEKYQTTLIFDDCLATSGEPLAPYSGKSINDNSMQLSASLRLSDIETKNLSLLDPTAWQSGPTGASRKVDTEYDRWVIRTRFETPHMNFNDKQTYYSLTSSELTLPEHFAQPSVARGMWHQFGVYRTDPDVGIFMNIDKVPKDWLSGHYDVQVNNTIYNNNDAKANRDDTAGNTKSLADLLGFDTSRTKLGRLKDSKTVYEAIVAIPYTVEGGATASFTESALELKKFIEIPQERIDAALSDDEDLDAAGTTIRNQLKMMDKYILPPELDFIGWPDKISPMAMYFFEFSYTFDFNDLAYMWQNLAPKDSKQITLQSTAVQHELINTEILSGHHLFDNPNLRWMVFKVKQRSQVNYWDYVGENARRISEEDDYGGVRSFEVSATQQGRLLTSNWPYDHFSFVEKIKIDAQILFDDEGGDYGTPLDEDEGDEMGTEEEEERADRSSGGS